MGAKVTGLDLIRLVGASAFIRGSYTADEGLVGVEVVGDKAVGSVFDFGGSPLARLQLVHPFENQCTCSEGGGCSHVAALGLAYLYRQAHAKAEANDPITREEKVVYDVPFLEAEPLRCLVTTLLAAFPGAEILAADVMEKRRLTVSEYEDFIWK